MDFHMDLFSSRCGQKRRLASVHLLQMIERSRISKSLLCGGLLSRLLSRSMRSDSALMGEDMTSMDLFSTMRLGMAFS